MIRQYEAELRDKRQELNNLRNQDEQRSQNLREKVAAVVSEKIQTTLREQYQMAMNMLINNGRTPEAARKEAYQYFVGKMLKPMEERNREEANGIKEGITADIGRIDSLLTEVDNELRKLDGN